MYFTNDWLLQWQFDGCIYTQIELQFAWLQDWPSYICRYPWNYSTFSAQELYIFCPQMLNDLASANTKWALSKKWMRIFVTQQNTPSSLNWPWLQSLMVRQGNLSYTTVTTHTLPHMHIYTAFLEFWTLEDTTCDLYTRINFWGGSSRVQHVRSCFTTHLMCIFVRRKCERIFYPICVCYNERNIHLHHDNILMV